MPNTSATQNLEIINQQKLSLPGPIGVTHIMTSLIIIPETAPKVNINAEDNGAFNPLADKNTSHLVAVKRCETYDPDPYATNSWTACRMSFVWHGDDVASFDDQIHTLICRNSKQATFRPFDQPAARVIMCASLLDSVIARTTYDLTTHNGEISFVNGKVHTGTPARLTFRAYTDDDGQRVIQEKRSKKKWKLFGTINDDGTVTPIIPSHLPQLAADDDPRYADAATNAQKKIRIIKAKASLINNPTEMMALGVSISFKGSCRSCNRVLTNPQSVADGIGPTCAKKESQAAVATSTVHAVTDDYDQHWLAAFPASREAKTASDAKVSQYDWSHPQLQDFDLDPKSLPLDAEQVLFCTSQLGAMGCSHAEIEQFFDDIFPDSPYWYPNFSSEAAKHDKSPASPQGGAKRYPIRRV